MGCGGQRSGGMWATGKLWDVGGGKVVRCGRKGSCGMWGRGRLRDCWGQKRFGTCGKGGGRMGSWGWGTGYPGAVTPVRQKVPCRHA
eukprot:364349-Chlamydomonas_euryale.AAC.5